MVGYYIVLLLEHRLRPLVFITTLILSQNTLAEPSIGMPSIQNQYCRPSVISVAILIATNSEIMRHIKFR